MDLLGGADSIADLDIIKTSSQPIQPISNSNNQDLLDLLGLGPISSTPMTDMGGNMGLIMENNNSDVLISSSNQNSNFLSGDLFSNISNGKSVFLSSLYYF